MVSMADRRQQRREYLWKKGAAYMLGWISFIAFFTAQLAAFWCLFQVAAAIADAGAPQITDQSVSWPWVFLWAGSASVVLISIAVSCAHFCERKLEEAQGLRHVPLVKAEALPAGEILVRASRIPTASQQSVLLWAVTVSREEPVEEMLHATLS